MKKILIITLTLLLAFSFTGCKKENNTDIDNHENNPDVASLELEAVRDVILDKLSIDNPIIIEKNDLMDLYGISEDMILQAASFVTMDGTFPHEIVMTEAKDASSADAVENLLNARLSEVLIQSKSYDAENYALAQSCKVMRNGNFVSIFLSPGQAEMLSIYSNYFN